MTSDSFSGTLLVPPDRGQILGRAMWKSRYVVVGRRGSLRDIPQVSSYPHKPAPSRTFSQNSKIREPIQSNEYVIAIYKSKEEYEATHQYPVNSVSDCQVQQLAHRKQGPVLPTLVITIADKEKKRRSSRAAGLISGKDMSTTTTLWFRTPPDDHHHSLHEWRHFILSRKLPVSPESPVSPTFRDPFASGSRDASETHRPGSGSRNGQRFRDTQLYIGERDGMAPHHYHAYESQSLRSKRSDVSSPTAATHPGVTYRGPQGQNYTTMLPTDIPADLPSPAVSSSEEPGPDLMAVWAAAAAAQGRSASISSPRQGVPTLDRRHTSVSVASPTTRESILDRAFQMRCIPGSERAVPGEEKLTSLARFDALMREAEEKRREEAADRARARAEEARQRGQARWSIDSDDSSDEEEGDTDVENEDEDEDETEEDSDAESQHGGYPHAEQDPARPRRNTLIPVSTRRALEFIASGRPRSPRPRPHDSSLEFDADAFPMPPANATYRPHTSHAHRRPDMAQRTQSTPHLSHKPVASLAPPLPEEPFGDKNPRAAAAPPGNGGKRLSFTEFTKRLSSTSSLLLAQPSVHSPGSSNRGSAEVVMEYHPVPPPRSSAGAQRASLQASPRGREGVDDREKRCGWRSSIVGGTEGGFP